MAEKNKRDDSILLYRCKSNVVSHEWRPFLEADRLLRLWVGYYDVVLFQTVQIKVRIEIKNNTKHFKNWMRISITE